MQKLPCEMAVWDSVPAIRAALAAEMVAKGLSQKTVAQMLGMAQSAVSQYLSGKRGYRIEFSEDVRHAVAELAEDMKTGKVPDPRARICEICVLLREYPEGCEACGSGT